jgi:hypothetical protein
LRYTFTVEEKTFDVNVQHKEINKETKYFFVISKIQNDVKGSAESTYVLNPINISSVSSEKDIPEYWSNESECFNWAHNWVDRNHKKL